MGEVRFDIVSDTHRYLSPALLRELEGADVIIHAGDVCSLADFRELEAIAPVYMCLGNNDRAGDYGPDVRRMTRFFRAGLRWQICHYRERLDLLTCDIAVCGHTHKPYYVPEKAACKAEGWAAHYECACGKWFTDEKGEQEVSPDSLKRSGPIGHRPSGTYSASALYHWFACVNPGCGEMMPDTKGKHQDANGDGKCDGCGVLLVTLSCRHLCHSENRFVQLVYRILCRFWKFFGVNETCECGAKHWD